MSERVIEGFNHEEFAKNLAGQAASVIPTDLSNEDKKFIIDTVYEFCILSGDALVKDESLSLDSAQASLITQLIGEWSFHKSIDLIRADINPSLRKGILQRVAFTVYEISKHAVSKRMPQEQIIPLVEHQVANCFKQAVDDLKAKGAIDESSSDKVLSQSNLDNMAQTQAEAEVVGSTMTDVKILKLASLALLIKNFPPEKIKNVIAKFNEPEAQVLIQYLKMQNLEEKLDKATTAKRFEEIKEILPEPRIISFDRFYKRLCKIVKAVEKTDVANVVKSERPFLKDFVLSPYTKQDVVLPSRVAAVVCRHLEEKFAL